MTTLEWAVMIIDWGQEDDWGQENSWLGSGRCLGQEDGYLGSWKILDCGQENSWLGSRK